jgi:hypothetical protein
MSSGTRPLNRTGPRAWIGAGIIAARRGLGFGALMLAGTGLLLALAAPLLLALLAVGRSRSSGAAAVSAVPRDGGSSLPVSTPGDPLGRQLLIIGLVLVALTGLWLLLLPGILQASRHLTRLTRRLAG